MASDRVSFSRFGQSFQESLMRIIVEDRAFADQLMEVLKDSYFELDYLRAISECVFSYKKKYNVHPSRDTVGTLINNQLKDENEIVKKEAQDYYERSLLSQEPIADIEYVKETSLDFCKKQELKAAMLKSIGLLEKTNFEEIGKIINEALKLGSDVNFGHDLLADAEIRFQNITRRAVSTNWPIIDGLVGGGFGKGELVAVVGGTGIGKSHVLVHLGSAALLHAPAGSTIVHITLELSAEQIGTRYDCCLSGFPIEAHHEMKQEIVEILRGLPNKLLIKEYPAKTASITTIRNYLDRLRRRDMKIAAIIIDYADLLKTATRDKRYEELEELYVLLRSLAQEFVCPLFPSLK